MNSPNKNSGCVTRKAHGTEAERFNKGSIKRPHPADKHVASQDAIGENCWMGHGTIIMSNLGRQNIIAAGSVITKDTNDYEVWAGNPAKMLKRLME